jgi:hypothetical protein
MPALGLPPFPVNPVLARVAVGVVTVLSVASALNYYRTLDEKNVRYAASWMTDTIGLSSDRFQGVAEMLPTDAVLGYVSDLPVSTQRGMVWFFGARYALAPRLIAWPDDVPKQEWILGNFSAPTDLGQIENENSLDLVRDLGSGVTVFRSR